MTGVEGQFPKVDGNYLFATEINRIIKKTVFTDDFYIQKREYLDINGVTESTWMNTPDLNSVYELLVLDNAATKTNFTYKSLKRYLRGTAGVNGTFVSETYATQNTINSAFISFDAEIVLRGDECDNSSVDPLWVGSTLSEGTESLRCYAEGTNAAGTTLRWNVNLKSYTNPVVRWKTKSSSERGGTRTLAIYINDGTTDTTIASSIPFYDTMQEFMLKIDSSTQRASLWVRISGYWQKLAWNIDISARSVWYIRQYYYANWGGGLGGGIHQNIFWMRIVEGTTKNATITYQFSANAGSNFQTVQKEDDVTLSNPGSYPVFKIVTANQSANEYVVINAAYVKRLTW